jgi:two-component system response regulator PilR (NtrC family)
LEQGLMPTVLIVDDEPSILEILEILLRDEGMEVQKCTSGRDALALLREAQVDVAISDIRMPDFSGVELLKEAKLISPDTVFIMITAFATTETAIEALQHGAFDYLNKPFKMDEVRRVLAKALDQKRLKHEAARLRGEAEAQHGQKLFQALNRSQLVGRSAKMLEVYRAIGTVAPAESTILITGESGTGKELVARAIHEASPRKDKPFLSVNCGAFPETLLESELFGYMKGAFTGAAANRKGLFEAADRGSIFLDEIGEMTPAMQVKLLRVLQEKKFRPLGSCGEIPADVRVIAATNKDLQACMRQGTFREDLYYRVAVITLHLPSLRDRVEDIELLANHFLLLFARKSGKKIQGISPAALHCLKTYQWPGNVRELENTIERAVALESGEIIQGDKLPDALRGVQAEGDNPAAKLPEDPFDLEGYLAGIEKSLICQALEQTKGNQALAASRLQLTKPSLRHKIQTLGINASVFRHS